MNLYNNMNGSGTMTRFPEKMPIGMAYVPYQEWETPYAENVALSRGTIFPGLDLPFIGEEAIPSGRKNYAYEKNPND